MSEHDSPRDDQPASPSRQYGTVWHPAREWLEEEDDAEDMDYMPGSEGGDEMEDDDLIAEEEDAAVDEGLSSVPELNMGDVEIQFDSDGLTTYDGPHGEDLGQASIAQLLNIGFRHLAHGWRTGPFGAHASDDDDFSSFGYRKWRSRNRNAQFPKVPSDAGTELMGSGDFGDNSHYVDELRKRKKALAAKLMWRELGLDAAGTQRRTTRSISQDMIPGSEPDKVIHYDSRCYSGQFSDDGNFFFSCAQDFKVRMYDTSNPYEWKYYKTVDYPFGQWTITDATLSPDNRFLAYSSIRNAVCLAATDPADESDPSILDFASRARRDYGSAHFGIWSIRFSGDGREIVAGTSDASVVVYDIETKQSILQLQNHKDDVNAVCFGDASSPHLLYSGSDDATLRVWDRRSMSEGREAGAFVGHTEGLTYVDSKGDSRYVLSNAKDQSMKLWDLRKMMPPEKFDPIERADYTSGYDYRFEAYPADYYAPHPHDCSVVTFRGHRVLKTLIRCHFSPPGSTNSRYVYTGSQDGKVYVYNLDATLARTIDVGMGTVDSRPEPLDTYTYDDPLTGKVTWKTCVRDASWHPSAPVLAATSWNGWGLSTGTCSLHTWNDDAAEDEGDPPVGRNYDSELYEEAEFDQFKETARQRRPRTRLGPGDSDDDF
ncbi:WD repeat protein [Aspergillus sp. HF37]|nr:WD repeat protein [Aspergillus sp. HF37]